MKRIKWILMLFLVTMTVTSFAQSSSGKFTLGVFGGLNIPKLSGGGGNELSSGYSSRFGAAFGLTSNLELNSKLSLRVDLLYSSEGGKRDGFQALDAASMGGPAGTYFYATFNNESILNYLELPVLLKYSIPVESSKFYVNLGAFAGYLLNATQKTSGSSVVYADKGQTIPVSINPLTNQPIAVSFDANTDIVSNINRMNYGLTGGFGYAMPVGRSQLILDVRGAYGLNYIQKDAANGQNHNGYLQVSLGYSIPL